MKKPFLLGLVLLIASAAAFADITFYNQPWNGGDFLCDANTPTCTADPNVTGWTVYDNFVVPNGVTRITDFTYVDNSFAWNFYTSTNWTVFGPNVANPFGVMPKYSGTAVATMTDLGSGYMMFSSITGLNLAVTPAPGSLASRTRWVVFRVTSFLLAGRRTSAMAWSGSKAMLESNSSPGAITQPLA